MISGASAVAGRRCAFVLLLVQLDALSEFSSEIVCASSPYKWRGIEKGAGFAYRTYSKYYYN